MCKFGATKMCVLTMELSMVPTTPESGNSHNVTLKYLDAASTFLCERLVTVPQPHPYLPFSLSFFPLTHMTSLDNLFRFSILSPHSHTVKLLTFWARFCSRGVGPVHYRFSHSQPSWSLSNRQRQVPRSHWRQRNACRYHQMSCRGGGAKSPQAENLPLGLGVACITKWQNKVILMTKISRWL